MTELKLQPEVTKDEEKCTFSYHYIELLQYKHNRHK